MKIFQFDSKYVQNRNCGCRDVWDIILVLLEMFVVASVVISEDLVSTEGLVSFAHWFWMRIDLKAYNVSLLVRMLVPDHI